MPAVPDGDSGNPYQSPQAPPEYPTAEGAGAANSGPPWEAAGPSFHSFCATAKAFYFSHQFFRTMRLRGGFGRPLLYMAIAHFIGDIYAGPVLGRLMWRPPPNDVSMGFILVAVLICLTASLIWVLVLSFLATAIYHTMLRGPNSQPFEATYRVVAYSHSHGFLLYLIPCCGYFLGVIGAVIFTIVGLTIVHGVSGWRAAAAVLIAVFVSCLAIAGMLGVFNTI
jgi:Yip1-like protein